MVILDKAVITRKQAMPLLDELAMELLAVAKVSEGDRVADDLAAEVYRVRLAAGVLDSDDHKTSDQVEEDMDALTPDIRWSGSPEDLAPGVSDADVHRLLTMAWDQICLDSGLNEYVVSKIRGYIVDLKANRIGPEFWERSHQTDGSPGRTRTREEREISLYGRVLTEQERVTLADQEDAIFDDTPVDTDRN